VFTSFWLSLFLSLNLAAPSVGLPFDQEKKDAEEKEKLKLHHEIVVTATRLPAPATELGNTVKVLLAENLLSQGLTNVAEVLAYLPQGFLTQNGGPGATASFLIRGANSEHTLVLIDGVEVNDPISPSRSYDFSHLLLTDVERIELVEGPQSPLYGSDAMAGIINIVTKKGGQKRFSLLSEAGSFATQKFCLSTSGQKENLSYGLAGDWFSTKGISAASSSYPGNKEKDGYTHISLSGRFGWQLGPQREINLAFRYLKAKTDLDNFGGPYGDDPNSQQDFQSGFLHLSYHSFQLNQTWEQKLSLAAVTNKRENRNEEDDLHPAEKEHGHFQSLFLKLDWQHNFYLQKRHALTCGLEVEREEGESEYLWSSAWGEDRSLLPRQRANSVGLYLQEHFKLGSGLSTTAGLRLDHHSRAGLAFTYRLAQAIWIEATATQLKTSLGTGFKAPSLYQLYAPPTAWGPVGNPALKPEKTLSWDLGLEQALFSGRLELAATYFLSRFRDLIQFDFAAGYQNLGRAAASGLRLEGYFKPASFVSGHLTWNWLEARDLVSETRLLRRPRSQIEAELELKAAPACKLTWTISRVGLRDDMDYSTWPASRVTLPAYTISKAAIVFQPISKLSFHLRAENLTNRHYEIIKGYGTTGFGLYAGLFWSF